MDNLQRMVEKLGQKSSVLTFDQALYCKSKEIQWRMADRFQNFVLRLGGFHVVMVFLAVLGKMFRDSGLDDALADSGVYACNTVEQIFRGSHYNRGIRCHKLALESMCRLQWLAVIEWYATHSVDVDADQIESAISAVVKAFQSSDNISECVENLAEETVVVSQLLEKFMKSNSENGTIMFWNQYIDMVCILLRYIRAERDGIWQLHLTSLAEMLPFFHAFDHTNYARWVPVYLADMHRLPETAPAVYEQFAMGNFPVKGSKGRFNQVWSDLKLEQSLNRYSKTSGGLIGITRNQNAVDRWHITASDRAKVLENIRHMCGSSKPDSYVHKEAGQSRLQRDEKDVQKLANHILSFCNPFTVTGPQIMNIVTGVVANTDVTSSLLSATSRGKNLVNQFVESRLKTNLVDFFHPLSKVQSKTFSSLNKTSCVKLKDKTVALTAERNLFSRLVVISQKRCISLPDLFQFELSAVPWSLAKSDGSLAKCNKSLMLHEHERTIQMPSQNALSQAMPTCCIVDGMAVIQMYKYSGAKTFGDYAAIMTTAFMRFFHISGCKRVDIVFDNYTNARGSIKSCERERRGSARGVRQNILSHQTQITLRWEKFIAEPDNKTTLKNFLTLYWKENMPGLLSEGQQLVIAGGLIDASKVILLQTNRCQQISSLFCNHEEADTRLVLHAAAASKGGFQRIVVSSPDTDVLILLVHFAMDIGGELWLRLPKGGRLYPAHSIARALGIPLCKVLPPFHATTGCDTTSCLVQQGKLKPWSLLKAHTNLYTELADLGRRPLEDISDGIQQYIASIYNGSPTLLSCNELRYKLFARKGLQNDSLPPTTDALQQHLKRAEHQTKIWISSLDPNPSIPDPNGNGWTRNEDGVLQPVLMTKEPMPKAIAELVKCGCKASQCMRRCSCKAAELACTDACPCEGGDGCKNVFKFEQVNIPDISSDEESDLDQ